jgi:FtsZ-binding cell division protein ZapB
LQDTLNEDLDEGSEDLSIRDSLEAAIVEVAASSSDEDTPTEIRDQTDRARDESGKFAKKPEGAPEAAEGDPPVKPEADKQPVAESGAPTSWNAQGRDLYAAAPPELQSYIRQREGEMQKGVEKLKSDFEGKANFADAMWKEIQPYDQMIRSEGGNPVAAVRDLLGMAKMMRVGSQEQKRGLLLETARQFGVDLGVANDPQTSDPANDALRREIDALKQQFQSKEQQQIEQQTAQLNAEIDKFKADKPHFDRVRAVMGELIEIGRAQGLDDAYQKAIRLDDELFQQIQTDAQKREAANQNAGERARKAKAAGSSVSGAPGMAGSGPTKAPAQSIRAEIEQAFNAQRA